MSVENQILAIENRINLLQGRTGRSNDKIVNKLRRRMRTLYIKDIKF